MREPVLGRRREVGDDAAVIDPPHRLAIHLDLGGVVIHREGPGFAERVAERPEDEDGPHPPPALIRLDDGDSISDLAVVMPEDEEPENGAAAGPAATTAPPASPGEQQTLFDETKKDGKKNRGGKAPPPPKKTKRK